MIVKENLKDKNGEITTEYSYDNTFYNIKKEKKHLVVGRNNGKNKKKYTYFHKFSKNTNFIYEISDNKDAYFLVSEYEKDSNGNKINCINLYIDYDYESKKMHKVQLFENCKFTKLEDILVSDNTIFLSKNGVSGSLYNILTNSNSKEYSRVFYKNEVKDEINKDIVFVEDIIDSNNGLISDKITYGVDANDFKIKTMIWSKLQKRLVKPYSKDDKRIRNKQDIESKDEDLLTIEKEIKAPLEEKSKNINNNKIYINKTVNKKFIKKLVYGNEYRF